MAEYQAVRPGHVRRRGHLDVVADERCLNPPDPADGGPAQHDGVLDLAVDDRAAVGDGGERADVGTVYPRSRADGGGAHDPRTADLGAALDHHAADELGRVVYRAVLERFGALQHHAVDLEHVGDVAGVLPVPRDDRGPYLVAGVEQPLQGLGDLEFPAPRRAELAHGLVHGGGENVDPHQREIAPRALGFLHQADHLPGLVELGDAELAWIRHRGQHDLRVGPGRPELIDQRGDAADDEIVAQVHNKIVAAQEVPRDKDRVGQPERGFLPDIGDIKAERLTIADGPLNVRRALTYHDSHVGNAGVSYGLEAIEQNGLIGHGDQLLSERMRNRAKPTARSPRQHKCLHDLKR